jgi:phosphoserine aminotransferase
MVSLTRNQLNFSGGPGALPHSVLTQLQEAMIAVPGVGLSILGISHRSDWFASVVHELESTIRDLLGVAASTRVLFLQGGATQQFSMLPMNLLRDGRFADYVHTGYWSGKAIEDARKSGALRLAWSGQGTGFRTLPRAGQLDLSAEAAYLHYVSNETAEGLQFTGLVGRDDVPRVCDMSSDFLAAPGDFSRYAMIYAHAQKNIGPAGVTVVVLRDDFLRTLPDDLPSFVNYHRQAQAHSVYNTPPVFAIYSILLVCRWIRDTVGGLEAMAARNARKASCVYSVLDEAPDFYRGRAAVTDRSTMNVVFDLPSGEWAQRFVHAAECAGFSGLNGHRSTGGVRASLYNGLELAAAEQLAGFMRAFLRRARISRPR